ncbi:uncharacterized protein At4g15970-like [Selaginella moellendorffii]|uniref:uncharacterized protein At4g15970-like n=1 Tax=Selaginella moellendorffii TaxID=88036 RepID=UPI000D1CB9AC|nr:uncharacterized protein At4g15970-like [Selaginella moellendorffii]|eukprot:XP_024524432.1 uncharacterized protein At4g15970-like [Selaginella moellendorffii]
MGANSSNPCCCRGRSVLEATVLALCVGLAVLPFAAIGFFSRPALIWKMELVFGSERIWSSSGSSGWYGRNTPQRSRNLAAPAFADLARSSNFSVRELLHLDALLSKAAFRNNTVIITTSNQAWAAKGNMLDMFLDSFRKGEGISSFLDHLLIVSLDKIAHDRCVRIHKLCFVLKTDGIDFSAEKFFMSDDYLKMMWRRVHFLGVVLQLGYDFVFSDADILWFRDPFKHFHPGADFEIACDQFYGSAVDLRNKPNGGYVHVRSNNRTVAFYKFWHAARVLFPGKHDQDVLNAVKYTEGFWSLGLKMRFLTTQFFGGFCQVSRDLEEVCTMHANCCTGLQRKINDLKLVVEDWDEFASMTAQEKQFKRIYWRAPRECLHSFGS